MSPAPHLLIEDLHTYFYSSERHAFIHSVDGVDLSVAKGETLGIVGESGSGKSITMLSVMGLIQANPGVLKGRVTLQSKGGSVDLIPQIEDYVELENKDQSIVSVKKDTVSWRKHIERTMKSIRGKEISMIFQNPKAALNPFTTVGKQIVEMVRLHNPSETEKSAREKAMYWLERVKIDDPVNRFDAFPGDLSGGMCQRAMVAMALASEPSLLIADEPTTGLDATIQASIVQLLQELKTDLGITMILISHDISVISALSDKVAVMYGGQVVEHGPARDILEVKDHVKNHLYTKALLSSIPDEKNVLPNGHLKSIEGEVPDTIDVPCGCRFVERCNAYDAGLKTKCVNARPRLVNITPDHRVRCWLYQE